MHDETLRDLLRHAANPVERLACQQQQLQIYSGRFADIKSQSDHFLKTGKRIVALECGHFVLTRALHRAACPRCGEMIRSGYDYESFRRKASPDEFNWPADPLMEINEGASQASNGAGEHREDPL